MIIPAQENEDQNDDQIDQQEPITSLKILDDSEAKWEDEDEDFNITLKINQVPQDEDIESEIVKESKSVMFIRFPVKSNLKITDSIVKLFAITIKWDLWY